MGLYVVRLPDVGEGIAEAELVAWHVAVGDTVTTETVLAEVMTDKATVEISSPVNGVVTSLAGTPGDTLAIGSDFVGIEVDGPGRPGTQPRAAVGEAASSPAPAPAPAAEPAAEPEPPAAPEPAAAAGPEPAPEPPAAPAAEPVAPRPAHVPLRPIAAPAVRQRARDLGVDLRQLRGTGPAGRITHTDLDRFLDRGDLTPGGRRPADVSTEQIPVIGLRRKIAEKLSTSASRIPHITYVDEVDVTEVEALRRRLNTEAAADDPRLTMLPFLMRAIVRAVSEQPNLNATYDDAAQVLTTSAGVHIGIATQTPQGLVVPVVRHAEALDPWQSAAELARLSEAARSGKATRDELSGSTITITSLGALGGLVTTPIINHPEVAIVGVNKMQVRPVWNGDTFVPRTMMNLSSSFDHRVVDGWDAATFIQRIKVLLEAPALLFIERPHR